MLSDLPNVTVMQRRAELPPNMPDPIRLYVIPPRVPVLAGGRGEPVVDAPAADGIVLTADRHLARTALLRRLGRPRPTAKAP